MFRKSWYIASGLPVRVVGVSTLIGIAIGVVAVLAVTKMGSIEAAQAIVADGGAHSVKHGPWEKYQSTVPLAGSGIPPRTNPDAEIFAAALQVAQERFAHASHAGSESDRFLGNAAMEWFKAGFPWVEIDRNVGLELGTISGFSSEVRNAYLAWREAAVAAGHDPQWSEFDRSVASAYGEIGVRVATFFAEHHRFPRIDECVGLPSNPHNGSSSVARSGLATGAHGWSYDEKTGKVKVVLPLGEPCRSVPATDIERIALPDRH